MDSFQGSLGILIRISYLNEPSQNFRRPQKPKSCDEERPINCLCRAQMLSTVFAADFPGLPTGMFIAPLCMYLSNHLGTWIKLM